MLTLDKKTILKEIEVLIRSIKVHYDNIENEHRIPTIELELITSKIRKLHEKSIIYNHLHYLEEETALIQKRERNLADVMDAMQAAGKPSPAAAFAPAVTMRTEPAFTQTTTDVPKPESPSIFSAADLAASDSIEKSEAQSEKPAIETPVSGGQQVKPMDLSMELGLNDRFWFINDLFGGKAEELDLALNNFSNTPTQAEARNFLDHLGVRFSWDKESEAYEQLLALLNKRFGKL